jgi:hypothetical protein
LLSIQAGHSLLVSVLLFVTSWFGFLGGRLVIIVGIIIGNIICVVVGSCFCITSDTIRLTISFLLLLVCL